MGRALSVVRLSNGYVIDRGERYVYVPPDVPDAHSLEIPKGVNEENAPAFFPPIHPH